MEALVTEVGAVLRWRCTAAKEAEGGATEAMVLATVRSGGTWEEPQQHGVEGGVAEEGVAWRGVVLVGSTTAGCWGQAPGG